MGERKQDGAREGNCSKENEKFPLSPAKFWPGAKRKTN